MAEEFNYDAPVEDIKPKDGGYTGPTEPYIGGVKLTGWTTEGIKKESTGQVFDTFTIEFTLQDEPQKGIVYPHVEWRPDSAEKATNQFKRVCFIITQFWPGDDKDAVYEKVREKLVAPSFAEFKAKVAKTLAALKAADKLDKVVKAKLVPGVSPSNGKPNPPRFPLYVGFMSDERTPRSLDFSKNELESIEKWRQARAAKPQNVSGGGSSGASSAAPSAPSADEEYDF